MTRTQSLPAPLAGRARTGAVCGLRRDIDTVRDEASAGSAGLRMVGAAPRRRPMLVAGRMSGLSPAAVALMATAAAVVVAQPRTAPPSATPVPTLSALASGRQVPARVAAFAEIGQEG